MSINKKKRESLILLLVPHSEASRIALPSWTSNSKIPTPMRYTIPNTSRHNTTLDDKAMGMT